MRTLLLLVLAVAPAYAQDGVALAYRQLLGEANERVAQLNAQVVKLTEEAKKCEQK